MCLQSTTTYIYIVGILSLHKETAACFVTFDFWKAAAREIKHKFTAFDGHEN